MGMGNFAVVVACGAAFVCVLLAVMYPTVDPRLRKKVIEASCMCYHFTSKTQRLTWEALQHFRKLNELTDSYRFRNVFLPGILKTRVPGTDGNTEVREVESSQGNLAVLFII